MKSIPLAVIFALFVISSSSQGQPEKRADPNVGNVNGKCAKNPDTLYNRQNVLERLAETLKKSVPVGYWDHAGKFRVADERAVLFFVHDLTDVSNRQLSLMGGECVDFIDGHVYHFAALLLDISFSHIVILERGELKIFSSINCYLKDDKIEDVLKYLDKQLANDKNKDEIISRVKKYRAYGVYYQHDNMSFLGCSEINSADN
jgi:hypothetical protein